MFVIDVLFTAGTEERWRELIDLYDDIRENADPSTTYQLDLHYGLSLLNLRRYSDAKKVLYSLYDATKERRMQFFATLADLSLQNIAYQNGRRGDDENLKKLLSRLHGFKDLKQYQQQESFAAGLIMESSYHLGFFERSFWERAIDEYDSLSEEVRSKEHVRFFYGLCLEENGELDKAVLAYESLPWRTDFIFTERYMISLIMAGRASEAIDVYREVRDSQMDIKPNVNAAYLLALDNERADDYMSEVRRSVTKYGNQLCELFESILYVDASKAEVKEAVIPALKKQINETSVSNLQFNQKLALIMFFARSGEILEMEDIFDTIEDLSEINNDVAVGVYKALWKVTAGEASIEKFEVSDELEAADRLSERFLYAGIAKEQFLQIKILCAEAKKSPYHCLGYMRTLYDITHDISGARNIVALLVSQKTKEADKYNPYLAIIENSNIPEYCMIAAWANSLLGQQERADFYSYKALYLLNDRDDFEIFRYYVAYAGSNLQNLCKDSNLKLVHGNVIVTLRKADKTSVDICLDEERYFGDLHNRSLGIRHVNPSSQEYVKIYGSSLKQVITINQKKYQITGIMGRKEYVFYFVFNKIQDNPEEFKDVVKMVKADDMSDLVDKLTRATDHTRQMRGMLALYHFERNDLGMPFDALTLHNYEHYIDVIVYLLYREGEVLCAGEPFNTEMKAEKYVLDISTLVLLSVLGRLDVLKAAVNLIAVPSSYATFFNELYLKSKKSAVKTINDVSFVDGKVLETPVNKNVSELLDDVISFCDQCQKEEVRDDERAEFQINDGLSGERLMTGFKLSFVHLDAMIIAQRSNATPVCDDWFFRKIAATAAIQNQNCVSFLRNLVDFDYICELILELSETNYTYLPFIVRNGEEAQKLIRNLLCGGRKKMCYEKILNMLGMRK